MSKDTLSRWCKNIPLSNIQKERLINNKISGQKKGSVIAAENKRHLRKERTKQIYRLASRELGALSKRDRFIAGIALYAGEGDKTDGKGGFANSDPKLIAFMKNWFFEFTHLPITKMRGAIWIHEGLDQTKAKWFWSTLTGIPIHQFHKTYIAKNKKGSNKIRKNLHNYGIFSLRFSDSAVHRKIMGWIYALLSDKITSVR